jgi:hypothetical protein
MLTLYKVVFIFNKSRVNDFKHNIHNFAICIDFFKTIIRENDNSFLIDCDRVKIFYDWVVD